MKTYLTHDGRIDHISNLYSRLESDGLLITEQGVQLFPVESSITLNFDGRLVGVTGSGIPDDAPQVKFAEQIGADVENEKKSHFEIYGQMLSKEGRRIAALYDWRLRPESYDDNVERLHRLAESSNLEIRVFDE